MLAFAAAAPWAVLQTAAWAGMALSYSTRTGSLQEGLSQTFDGRHPCALCLAVERGRAQENASLRAAAALPWALPVAGGLVVLLSAALIRRRICALSVSTELCLDGLS